MFEDISWVGVLVAGIVSTGSGALWFGPKTFFPVWWRLIGHPPGTPANPGGDLSMVVVFGSTIAAQFVQALTMSVVINLAINAGFTASFGIVDGALLGLVVGGGIAAASSLSHRLFGGHGFAVWAIEVGNDVLNLVLMGAILGYFQGA